MDALEGLDWRHKQVSEMLRRQRETREEGRRRTAALVFDREEGFLSTVGECAGLDFLATTVGSSGSFRLVAGEAGPALFLNSEYQLVRSSRWKVE